MDETEFPESKACGTVLPSVGGARPEHNSLLPSSVAWLSGLVVLTLSISVASCTKPRRTLLSTSGDTPSGDASATSSTRRININTANASEFEALPGVGKVLAERIVNHRERNGPFRRTEHLMMVRGFSENKFRALRERITLE